MNVTLAFRGGEWTWRSSPSSVTSGESSLVKASLHLQPHLAELTFESVAFEVSLKEIRRIRRYLSDHMEQLRVAPDRVSYEFTGPELAFNLVAGQGDVDASDGAFPLTIMLNVGKAGEPRSSVYAGVTVVVEVSAVRRFLEGLVQSTA